MYSPGLLVVLRGGPRLNEMYGRLRAVGSPLSRQLSAPQGIQIERPAPEDGEEDVGQRRQDGSWLLAEPLHPCTGRLRMCRCCAEQM